MISLFIFTSSIRAINYGIGTYVNELTNSLSKFHDLEIFRVYYNSDKIKEFTVEFSNNQTDIFIPRPIFNINSENKFANYSARVIDLLEDFFVKSQNVVIQVNYPSSLPIVKEVKRRFNFPVISVIHSANWQLLTIGNKKEFLKVWLNRDQYDKNTLRELIEEKELYEVADKIVSVTEYMKNFIIEYYSINPKKVTVVRNGMDYSKFRLPTKMEKLKYKKDLGFNDSDKILLFSGRLDKSKGIEQLLLAFNEVFIRDKTIRLVLIGEDSGMESIRYFLSLLKESWHNVTFTGFLSRKDLIKFYHITDIGIMPSIFDHCPYSALEMVAHKIPLIISYTEGLNEMFNYDQVKYINPVIDIDGNISFDKFELANAIITLLKDNKTRNKMIADNLSFLKNKFSGDEMARKMYDVYSFYF